MISKVQKEKLEQLYLHHPNPSDVNIQIMAEKLKIRPKKVQKWFQYKKAAAAKKEESSSDDHSSDDEEEEKKPAKKAAAKKKGKTAEVLEESDEDVVSEPPMVSQNLNTKKIVANLQITFHTT